MSSSFVHTSSFSLPISPVFPDPQEPKVNLESEFQVLLENALASCSHLALENTKIQNENKELKDKLAILQECSSLSVEDSAVFDVSVATLRGKLLHESRLETEQVHRRLLEEQDKLRALEEKYAIEKHKHAVELERADSALKRLQDVEALSTARGNAVERLDRELIALRAEEAHWKQQPAAANTTMTFSSSFTETPIKPPPPPLSSSSSNEKRESALLRQEALDLRRSLASAIEELKLISRDRTQERFKFNAILTASMAKLKALEATVSKLKQKCRDVRLYKFLTKKAVAELASFVGKRTVAIS